jgi:hypothetical protein
MIPDKHNTKNLEGPLQKLRESLGEKGATQSVQEVIISAASTSVFDDITELGLGRASNSSSEVRTKYYLVLINRAFRHGL